MKHPHLIPSIFNYCDRWCERCAFIDRCSMGVIEQKRWAKGKDWKPEDFFDALDKMYPPENDQFAEWLEENGIDLDALEPEDLPEKDLKTKALEEEMRRRGLLYHNGVMQFLRDNDAKLKAGGIDLFSERERHEGRDTHERSALADAVDVILWYLHLTFVKANRAVGGLEDMHDLDIWDSPQQSDANGSAKLSMLCAGRSLAAWESVRRHWPDQQNDILGFMRQLNGFRRRMEQVFPDWRRFIRPGFDTEQAKGAAFGDN